MPRPHKKRIICEYQEGVYFKVRGIPLGEIETVILQLDELEALRLAHLEGRTQEEGAQLMEVSRSTFGRILESAHRKIARTLVEKCALKIEGGPIIMKKRQFICRDCEKSWEEPFGTGRPEACPQCGSDNFHRADAGPSHVCGQGQGRSRARGGGRKSSVKKE